MRVCVYVCVGQLSVSKFNTFSEGTKKKMTAQTHKVHTLVGYVSLVATHRFFRIVSCRVLPDMSRESPPSPFEQTQPHFCWKTIRDNMKSLLKAFPPPPHPPRSYCKLLALPCSLKYLSFSSLSFSIFALSSSLADASTLWRWCVSPLRGLVRMEEKLVVVALVWSCTFTLMCCTNWNTHKKNATCSAKPCVQRCGSA